MTYKLFCLFSSKFIWLSGNVYCFISTTPSPFPFIGPSYSVDTACSSSMMCLDQALMNIRMGIIDSAVVGGSNLCVKPCTSLQFVRMGMVSPDGACKAFDESGRPDAIQFFVWCFLCKLLWCNLFYFLKLKYYKRLLR